MMFLIASHAPAAMVLMPFQMPEIVFFRFSHSFLMVSVTEDMTGLSRMLSHTLVKKLPRPDQRFRKKSPMPFQTVSAVDFMPSQSPVKKSLMPFHAPSAVDLIPSQRPEKKSPIPFQIVDAVSLILFHRFTKKSLMAFQTVTATSLTFSHRLIQNSRKPSQLFQR